MTTTAYSSLVKSLNCVACKVVLVSYFLFMTLGMQVICYFVTTPVNRTVL